MYEYFESVKHAPNKTVTFRDAEIDLLSEQDEQTRIQPPFLAGSLRRRFGGAVQPLLAVASGAGP